MTPQEFVRKWQDNALSERSAAQQHFLDLCDLFGHPKPADIDKLGTEFTFERGLTKTGGGTGFADVWKRGFFAWEYKKKRRNLDLALEQLTRYASALENPPLHVACDTNRFKIVTAWTNLVPKVYELELVDLLDPDKRKILAAVFNGPDALRPGITRERLTREAADKFTTIADRLNHRHPDREAVAHFINQLAFCFFAEDVKLLPEGYFSRLLKSAQSNPARAKPMLDELFAAMQHGGYHGVEEINHFNGGLFDERRSLPLEGDELRILFDLGKLEWDQVDPTIFGTLFERFLDPDKRAQIGAHYTDPEKIMMIVEPVIVRPLLAEWAAARIQIAGLVDGSIKPPKSAKGRGSLKPDAAAIEVREGFLERLRAVTVLDPACGSGNFLYLALHAIKDIENRALLECEALGLPSGFPTIGPEILHGIEINPLAAELARTTIWIGFIQWEIKNSLNIGQRPILKKLNTIECRDALITAVLPAPSSAPPSPLEGEEPALGPRPGGAQRADEGSLPPTYVEATWPAAEFIVGNPPFLGGKRLRRELGDTYVDTLFCVYDKRVPREADLVTYWFEKARAQIASSTTVSAGLVSTNSIRNGSSRKVLDRVFGSCQPLDIWSDEPWVVEGAAVRVSLVSFTSRMNQPVRLDGVHGSGVNSLLRSTSYNLQVAAKIADNLDRSFQGVTKGGPFEVERSTALDWLTHPVGANGRVNSDVLRPITSGGDIVKSRELGWVVDFTNLNRNAAAYYEGPFSFAAEQVAPFRAANRRAAYRENWWLFAESRPRLREHLAQQMRYIAAPKVSQHRLFVWMPTSVLPDNLVIAIAREDDTSFGILSSRFHIQWSLALGATLEDRPTYTPTTTFETFPFPEGLAPNIPAADYAADPRAMRIAAAAKALDDARRAWLNPADLVDIVPEIVPTAAPGEEPVKYPDRIVPKNDEAAAKLKDRTLTKLYNARPQWLADLHDALDRAVAAAYGWPEDITTDDALARLLALNLDRAAAGR